MYIDMETVTGVLILLALLAVSYAFVVVVFVIVPNYKRIKQNREQVQKDAERIRKNFKKPPSVRQYQHGVNVFNPDKGKDE